MRGCSGGACVVAPGGRVWFYSGGHVWFYSGGACMVLFRGCVVLFGGHAWFYSVGGGACMVFFSFFGYNEIRSMSGRYASYWNAFLFQKIFGCKNEVANQKRHQGY